MENELKSNPSVWKEFTEAQTEEKRKAVSADPDRLSYHLMPPVGWLNDPNGLCELDGTYHIFYQYTPAKPDGQDHRGWGHYTTKDFHTYREEDDTLVPDTIADARGAYSGSAFIDNGKIHFFYTGNNKLPGDFDYINEGRTHWTLHFTSDDGYDFTDKEVVMKNEDYPEDLSCHVRDPKVLKDKDGIYYMVLGARTKDSKGQAEIFSSPDLKQWTHSSTIRPDKPFGYMWECPDLFDVDGQRILITCPQGIPGYDPKTQNIYQSGWFAVNGPLTEDQIVAPFTHLDDGFDFYAPQSFEDEKHRRILIGWMGMPDTEFTNPTVENGWQHALTLPRELHWRDGHLYQYPIEEILELRGKREQAGLNANEKFELPGAKFDLLVQPEKQEWTMKLRKDVELIYQGGILTLSMGKSGSGRTERHIDIAQIHEIEIFSDTSSLEIFVNHGERAFSTRVYDEQYGGCFTCTCACKVTCWTMNGFTIEEKLEKNLNH